MREEPGLDVAAADRDDFPAVRELLAANGLPIEDLADPVGTFLIARDGGALAGVVGLEAYGRTGLLRSLCVPAARRKRGIAGRLCAAVEAVARGLQVNELCLLTTTARAFFERQGFAVAPRAGAAPELQASPQLRDLCPSSAMFMRKPLAPAGARYLPGRLLALQPDVPGARMWKVALDGVAMTYFEVDAGVRFERHAHAGEQITTVTDGELFFELDGTTVRVGPGDAIAIPVGVPHAVFTRERSARAFDAWSALFPPERP